MKDKRTLIALVAVSAIVAAGGGWAAGSRIKPPGQAQLEAAAPEPSRVTVPVELRRLASNINVRGDVVFADTVDLRAGASGEVASVVTGRVPAAGSELTDGDVAIEVSGRPMFVLEGQLPTYRNLSPGNTGDDVLQLEEALQRLGHAPGAVDGVYDGGTELAVQSFYEAAGYQPLDVTESEQGELDSARSRVESAEDALRIANAQLAEAKKGPSNVSLVDARNRVAAAERAVPEAADQGAGALRQADAEIARLQRALTDAETTLAAATAETRAASQNEVNSIRADLQRATDGRTETQRANGRSAAAAADELTAARAALAALTAAPEVAAQLAEVTDASEDLAAARAEVTRLDGRYGVRVPAGEIVFLPSVPRRVTQVNVERGQAADGVLMTLSGAQIHIDASLSTADRPLVQVGSDARIVDGDLGIDVAGTVTEIAETSGTNGVGSSRYAMRVVPAENNPERLAGLNIRVEIAVESTDGEVLAVPLAALSAAADGTSRVQVETSPDEVRTVLVTVGLAAQGYAEITPSTAGELQAGDQVVIGSAPTGTSPDEPTDDVVAGDAADRAEQAS